MRGTYHFAATDSILLFNDKLLEKKSRDVYMNEFVRLLAVGAMTFGTPEKTLFESCSKSWDCLTDVFKELILIPESREPHAALAALIMLRQNSLKVSLVNCYSRFEVVRLLQALKNPRLSMCMYEELIQGLVSNRSSHFGGFLGTFFSSKKLQQQKQALYEKYEKEGNQQLLASLRATLELFEKGARLPAEEKVRDITTFAWYGFHFGAHKKVEALNKDLLNIETADDIRKLLKKYEEVAPTQKNSDRCLATEKIALRCVNGF